MRRIASVVVFLAGISLFAQGEATRQHPQPTFRTGANLTEVDAIVTDKNGSFVRGLTRDDFEVFEDQKPQTVSSFSLVDLPMHAAVDASAPRSDVATNKIEGRIFLLVIDNLNVGATRGARKFILDDMAPDDLASVLSIGRYGRGCEFTSDKARLLAALDPGGKPFDPAQVANDAKLVPSGASGRGGDVDAQIAEVLRLESEDEKDWYVDDTRHSFQMLEAAAQYLAGIHGRRKAILLFSGGIAIDMHSGAPSSDSPRGEIRGQTVTEAIVDLTHAAQRANVSVYTIDERTVGGSDPIGRESLNVIANETGGRAITDFNDLAGPFHQIVEDTSTYYLLGYYGPFVKSDGSFHEIKVSVKRPDLKVQARKGYVAPSSHDDKVAKAVEAIWAKTDLSSLLSRSVPTSDLGLDLRATAAPVRSHGKNVIVAVSLEVAAGGLAFTNENDVFADDIEIAHVAIDDAGAFQAKGSETANLRLKPQTYQAVAAHGWRYLSQLDLAPGRYQLRMAVHEKTHDASGAVYVDLDVPDFTKAPLQVSTFALSSPRASEVPTAGTLPALAGLLPGPPMATRTFHETDRLGVFARVSENASAAHTVDIETIIRNIDGKEVLRSGKSHDAAAVAASSPGYLAIVPLSGLHAGSYVLTISATSSLGGNPSSRSIPFTIE